MKTEPPGSYILDSESLRLNAYRLLCLFYSNKEIARLSDPDDPTDAAARLERAFFLREMSHLLLNIAVGLRVLDDQMLASSSDNADRKQYLAKRDKVNQNYTCMMFENLSLREVCNKIIHAVVVEPDSTTGQGSHKVDEENWLSWVEAKEMSGDETAPEPEPIEWEHLSGLIRLGGQKNGKQWWQLLEVPTFVAALDDLLS